MDNKEEPTIKSVVYLENDLMKCTLQEIEGFLYVHVDVFSWKPSDIKMLRVYWQYLKLDAWHSGYDQIFAYNQYEKFSKLMDPTYEKLGDEKLTVLMWTLESPNGS